MRKLLLVVALVLIGCGGMEEAGDSTGSVAAQDELPSSCGRDTWKSYAAKFFRNECQRCHAQGFSSAAEVDSSGARAAIASGRMPRDKPLTAAKRKRILAWFACGSP